MKTTTTSMVELALAVALSSAFGCGQNDARADSNKAGPPPPPAVTVAEVLVQKVTNTSEYTGRASAVETVDIHSQATGYLERVAFKEGDVVGEGQLLFVVDPRPSQAALLRARATLASAKANQALGQRETVRTEKLFASSVVAERERDNQASSLLVTDAQIQVAEAQVTSAKLDLDYSYIRSPIKGRIGRVLVTKGNLVGPSLATPLATVRSMDPLYVYVDVDEGRVVGLAGARAEVGFPGEEGRPHAASVDFVDTRVDPSTGTLQARVVVPNADGKLTPGLFARVVLLDATSNDAVLVLDRALVTDQDKKFVWTLGADNAVHYRGITPGPLHGNLRVIVDGLSRGDKVVISGLQRLRPDTKVTPQLAPMGDEGDAGAP